MNEVSAPIFSLGTASIGVGVTPKTLRHWIDRGFVHIAAERTPGGHYRFSWGDILVLSMVVELNGWGVTIDDAYNLTQDVRRHIGMLGLYKKTPIAALEAAISNMHLFLKKRGDNWTYSLKDSFDPTGPGSVTFDASCLRVSPGQIFRLAKIRVADWEEGVDDAGIGPDGLYHGAVLSGGVLDPEQVAKLRGDKPTE